MIVNSEEEERLHPILYDPRFQWETSRPPPREILHDHIVCTATLWAALHREIQFVSKRNVSQCRTPPLSVAESSWPPQVGARCKNQIHLSHLSQGIVIVTLLSSLQNMTILLTKELSQNWVGFTKAQLPLMKNILSLMSLVFLYRVNATYLFKPTLDVNIF